MCRPTGVSAWGASRTRLDQLSLRSQARNLASRPQLVFCVSAFPERKGGAHDEIQIDRSGRTFAGTRGSGNSGVRDFPDLANQTVVTNAGTVQEVILSRMNVEKKLGMKIIATKDYAESFEMLQTGRAKAFMLEDITLMGARTLAKNPSEWQITGAVQSREPYAFVFRKDDAAFKNLADTALRQTFSSPEITTLYTKWFRSPIPPKNVNFDLEISPELKELYASPNDEAAN